MAKTTTTEIDKKEVKRAQDMWTSFTVVMKWTVIVVCFVLAAMAAVFIR